MPRLRPITLLFLVALGAALSTPAALAVSIPKVELSGRHKKMCRVGVGDAMPTPVASGKAATVVAFVKRNGWMTRQLLKDLPLDVAKAFDGQGVATHVVRVGSSAPPVTKLSTVEDKEEKLFAQTGSGAAPRVYVLDAKGKIAWFDIEYSRATRRELRQTLEALTTRVTP